VAAAAAPDVTVLVNNAGVLAFGSALDGDLSSFERDLRTNYLGTLRVTRAFVSTLERNAPAAVVNVLTVVALAPMEIVLPSTRILSRMPINVTWRGQ
jgi:short-subunit dehydrogenase